VKREEIKTRLEAAKLEMNELLQEKVLLDLKIGQLSQTMNALMSMLEPKPPDATNISDAAGLLFGETGISGAIRLLLTRSERPLTPVQIRTELINHGFDLSDYANAMAVVHNTLKRLQSQGELMTVQDPSGQAVAYTTRFQAPMDAATAPNRAASPGELKRKLEENLPQQSLGKHKLPGKR
jgi:hypothetical protein